MTILVIQKWEDMERKERELMMSTIGRKNQGYTHTLNREDKKGFKIKKLNKGYIIDGQICFIKNRRK